ncbi:MAG: acyl--CoA ligase [Ruminococcus sp.]|nr:acyl--CoA ligase [Ruminococcus sp.]
MLNPSKEVFRKYMDPDQFERIVEMDSVSEMWANSVKQYPDTVAVEDNGRQYTYAQIDADISGLRTLLKSDGRTKRVGIYCPNSYDFVRSFLAVTTLGYTAVILSAQLDAMTVFGCTMKFGLDQIICHPSLTDNTAIVAAKRPDVTVIASDAVCDTPAEMTYPSGETPCVIMFTGGTTGRSKGALLSNSAVMQGTVNGCYGYKGVFSQRYLLVLPLSHVFGLIRNLTTALYTGSTLFICRNNKDMFRDIAMFRPTIMVVVPALAEMALNLSKKFGKNMLGDSLKTIICGAAAVPPYLIREYKNVFDIDILPGYGLTESANLVSGNPENLNKPESVGLLYPNQQVKVVDGELRLKGANMMLGYVGEEEEGVYDEEGYFRTGDLVRFDEDGFLYITGRIKEIIVLPTGENISPAELEVRFLALDLIQDAQVYEDVTEEGSHFLALEVVPRAPEIAKLGEVNPVQVITDELEKINNTLPTEQRVSRIIVRDSDFERTPSMKIKRYKKC